MLGLKRTVSDIVARIGERKNKAVHCSLDIDVIDPQFCSGNRHSRRMRMHPDQIRHIIYGISSQLNVVSWYLVELNPLLDINGITVNLLRNCRFYCKRQRCVSLYLNLRYVIPFKLERPVSIIYRSFCYIGCRPKRKPHGPGYVI